MGLRVRGPNQFRVSCAHWFAIPGTHDVTQIQNSEEGFGGRSANLLPVQVRIHGPIEGLRPQPAPGTLCGCVWYKRNMKLKKPIFKVLLILLIVYVIYVFLVNLPAAKPEKYFEITLTKVEKSSIEFQVNRYPEITGTFSTDYLNEIGWIQNGNQKIFVKLLLNCRFGFLPTAFALSGARIGEKEVPIEMGNYGLSLGNEDHAVMLVRSKSYGFKSGPSIRECISKNP